MSMLEPASILMLEVSRTLPLCFQNRNAGFRQLKQVEEENTRLKKLVAELTLDKVMLQDVLAKKF